MMVMVERFCVRFGSGNRAGTLWSNPDDLVYSPFTGIGSEGFGAVNLSRRFVGSELKRSYFEQACANLKNAKSQKELVLA